MVRLLPSTQEWQRAAAERF
ncbi:MAG: hypothetical protein YYHSYBAR_000487, partial [Candidatus Fervidibacter sacchari]